MDEPLDIERVRLEVGDSFMSKTVSIILRMWTRTWGKRDEREDKGTNKERSFKFKLRERKRMMQRAVLRGSSLVNPEGRTSETLLLTLPRARRDL